MKKLLTTHYPLPTKHGFTLIELLLYVAIVSGVILSASIFLQLVFATRAKNQTIGEVEMQGALVMERITQTIRNGTLINSPAIGTSASSVSVAVVDGTKNPTVFDLSSGSVRMTEGASSAIALTSPLLSVSGLSFTNRSNTATPNTVHIEFTVTYINAGGRNEYDFSKTFYGSATLRR